MLVISIWHLSISILLLQSISKINSFQAIVSLRFLTSYILFKQSNWNSGVRGEDLIPRLYNDARLKVTFFIPIYPVNYLLLVQVVLEAWNITVALDGPYGENANLKSITRRRNNGSNNNEDNPFKVVYSQSLVYNEQTQAIFKNKT